MGNSHVESEIYKSSVQVMQKHTDSSDVLHRVIFGRGNSRFQVRLRNQRIVIIAFIYGLIHLGKV